MLDYMDENVKDSSQEKAPSLTESLAEGGQVFDGDDEQLSDGEDEYLTSSVGNSNSKKSTLILVAIFAVVAGSLMLMIKSATPRSASAAQNTQQDDQIELAIAKLSGIKAEIFDKMDNIARKFEEVSNIEQISVDQLKKNPFRSRFFIKSQSLSSNSSGSTYFILDSIIQSDDGNLCMIDGNIYRQGDQVNGYVVKQVGRDFVRLETTSDVKILKINMQ